ncbi:MAG: hypothetical protein HC927_05205, partial [Deltaproteobacteria bacterium]|nr:hypothetical protein [Deltaproteobacteria bacterium]
LAHDFPLPPIRAELLRDAPAGEGREWQRYFCRWVAEHIDAGNIAYAGDWGVEMIAARTIGNLRDCLDEPAAIQKTWMLNGSGDCLALRARPDEHEGRVKMWRKQARIGRLPPIVVWWISGLDCWVLIDGHRRLLAAVLEGREVEVIGVYSFHDIWYPTEEAIAKIELERATRARGGALTERAQIELDRRLVEVHRGYRMWRTRAWARVGRGEGREG